MSVVDAFTVIRCEHCGAELAREVAGCVIVKRHGLELVAREVVSLKCPDCRRLHTVAQPRPMRLAGVVQG